MSLIIWTIAISISIVGAIVVLAACQVAGRGGQKNG